MAVKMVPTVGVVVVRDGARVKPKIGESFEFTAAERDAILEAQPGALRKSVNEDAASTAMPSAEASQAKARGGKKAATAAKADGEVDDTDPPEGEQDEPGAGTREPGVDDDL